MNLNKLNRSWREHPPPKLSLKQKQWLTRSGALTTALRRYGQVQIQVLGEYSHSLRREEALSLNLNYPRKIWVREITIRLDGRPIVIARSVTPIEGVRGVWKKIRQLNSRPLANILYCAPDIQRSRFESTKVCRPQAIFHTLKQLGYPTQALYARRSVFNKHGVSLMVCECFLPEAWEQLQ